MNKIEFRELKNKEDMIIAFNQLKDDYHQLFEENEILKCKLNNVCFGDGADPKAFDVIYNLKRDGLLEEENDKYE